MPRILDNIDAQMDTALLETLRSSYAIDASIGYFNLTGWGLIAHAIDQLSGTDDNRNDKMGSSNHGSSNRGRSNLSVTGGDNHSSTGKNSGNSERTGLSGTDDNRNDKMGSSNHGSSNRGRSNLSVTGGDNHSSTGKNSGNNERTGLSGNGDSALSGGGLKARVLVGMTETPQEELQRSSSGGHAPPIDNNTASKARIAAEEEMRQQLQVGRPTANNEIALRALLDQIDAGHVQVKLHTAHRLHAKLYLCHRSDSAAPRVGYVGSSNLTVAGLREQGELNVDVVDSDATAKLAQWFNDRWEDRFTLDVTPALIQVLQESWASRRALQPYLVYLKMAYHLSKEAREGLIEYGLPASMERELLEFQAAAVKTAARIITHRGGAIVGDVVGLGKTLMATAIARLLQDENGYETLVVCPKNLVEMWEGYLHRYEVRGRVVSLSMVHKELPKARRHRLVIVDEAHNLRNEKRRDYKAIKKYVGDNDSKVLLLTATPYNKSLTDLAALLSLFVASDQHLGLRPEHAIADVGEAKFAASCDGQTSTLVAFRKSTYLGDWQALMSLFLVRRTRGFIKKHYAETDKKGRSYLVFGNGGRFYFPQRIAKPIDRNITKTDPASEMMSDRTIDAISNMKLPRYQLGNYIKDTYTPSSNSDQELVADLRSAAQGNLAGINRVTMFKRLSSSGPAFLKTLRRHQMRNLLVTYAIDHQLPIPIGSVSNALLAAETDTDQEETDTDLVTETNTDQEKADTEQPAETDTNLAAETDTDQEKAEDGYRKLVQANPRGVRWADPQIFTSTLRDDLTADTDTITEMLTRFGRWQPHLDTKMAALTKLIQITHPDDKILVFSEAADTAHYVADELESRGITDVAAVTGNSPNPTDLARRFSPVSNPNSKQSKRPLRVLVSTDVLSEGQNLQDSHIVVNYDLPWAIIKLVQRAGRVDRIGQQSPEVLVYSLLPAGKIEEEIKLRQRIRERLNESGVLLGSDERFFGDENEPTIVEGLYDEDSNYYLNEDHHDMDPVSMAYEIWRHACQDHPALTEKVKDLPNLVHATKARPSHIRHHIDQGVLVHSQTVTGFDAFAVAHTNGRVRRLTPQDALRFAECFPDEPPVTKLDDHYELIGAALDGPLRAPPTTITTALQGLRKRVWGKLHADKDTFCDNLLFSLDDFNAAHEAIANRPLTESATQKLANAYKDRSSQDLAALVVSLYLDETLCVPAVPTRQPKEPSIICAMGFAAHN